MTLEVETETQATELARSNGRPGTPTPSQTATTSTYLQYLPGVYQSDPFMGRFLMIFESILGPLERTVDNLPRYFDPRCAPVELLPWLAAWVGVELDENWPVARQRELILWAARLYRWRGTRRGLREHLRVYTGRTPLIVENFDGLRVDQDAALGINTRLGDASAQRHRIVVTVFADDPESLDERVLRSIIELEIPAHVAYTLDLQMAVEGQSG